MIRLFVVSMARAAMICSRFLVGRTVHGQLTTRTAIAFVVRDSQKSMASTMVGRNTSNT
ncbi:MAG: hypothetical protein AAF367_16065 [Pseudomonadota bacterium]